VRHHSVFRIISAILGLLASVNLALAAPPNALVNTSANDSPAVANTEVAQPRQPPRTVRDTLPEELLADYDAARWLWEAGDFRGAELKFQVVYDRSKDPRLLWNVAICEKALRRYAKALPLVRRYLAEAEEQLSADEKQEAQALVLAIESFVGPLRIDAGQAGATVLVDDEEVGKTPLKQPLLLDMGDHKLTLQKRGFKEVTSYVRVLGPDGKDRVTLTMERDIPAATLEIRAGKDQWISVDGSEVGRDRWEGLVSPSIHRVRVSGTGYKTQEVNADLSDGGHTSVWLTARPLDPSEKGYLWPLVAVLTGVTAVTGIVAYYGLRPSETHAVAPEQGRLGNIEAGFIRGKF